MLLQVRGCGTLGAARVKTNFLQEGGVGERTSGVSLAQEGWQSPLCGWNLFSVLTPLYASPLGAQMWHLVSLSFLCLSSGLTMNAISRLRWGRGLQM